MRQRVRARDMSRGEPSPELPAAGTCCERPKDCVCARILLYTFFCNNTKNNTKNNNFYPQNAVLCHRKQQ